MATCCARVSGTRGASGSASGSLPASRTCSAWTTSVPATMSPSRLKSLRRSIAISPKA